MRKIVTALALLGMASSAHAQAAKTPTDQSTYIGAEKMQSVEQSQPPAFSTRLIEGGVYSMAFIRLAKPDTPHAHGVWSEIFVIKEGSGVLTTNGKITGITGTNSATHGAIFTDQNGATRPAQPASPARAPRASAPGDLAGTAIEGGTDQRVKPGDVILIPAGVPHTFTKVDQPIVYLDIKFPKQEYVKDMPGVGGN